jgi:hypothetical protein
MVFQLVSFLPMVKFLKVLRFLMVLHSQRMVLLQELFQMMDQLEEEDFKRKLMVNQSSLKRIN